MASYLRPRRGKKATALSQNITLKAGEVFFETPTTGVGTGAGRIMMGNGSNNYTYLNNNKKAFITDINCPDCYISNFTATAGNTTLSNNDTYLNNMKPGATASTFFTNLWTLLSSHNKQLTQLNNDLLKVALYSNIYTVDGGKTREVVITANNLGISPSSDVRTVIVSNGSNNPSIYFVSNTQWEVGIGVHIYISNNSSQANIAIRVTALYI